MPGDDLATLLKVQPPAGDRGQLRARLPDKAVLDNGLVCAHLLQVISRSLQLMSQIASFVISFQLVSFLTCHPCTCSTGQPQLLQADHAPFNIPGSSPTVNQDNAETMSRHRRMYAGMMLLKWGAHAR